MSKPEKLSVEALNEELYRSVGELIVKTQHVCGMMGDCCEAALEGPVSKLNLAEIVTSKLMYDGARKIFSPIIHRLLGVDEQEKELVKKVDALLEGVGETRNKAAHYDWLFASTTDGEGEVQVVDLSGIARIVNKKNREIQIKTVEIGHIKHAIKRADNAKAVLGRLFSIIIHRKQGKIFLLRDNFTIGPDGDIRPTDKMVPAVQATP